MPNSPLLVQRKAALRRELVARRAEVAARLGAQAAEAIALTFERAIALEPEAVVSGYWPLAGELDPRPLLHRALARGQRLALPRMEGKGLPLQFHEWRPDTPLVPGPFKVMEPAAGTPLAHPDLVLAPLLAFDRNGGRLGYGAGFYDRTIRALRAARPHLLAIGVGFAAQELDEVPMGPSDERLDGVLTEAGLWPCSPRLAALAEVGAP